MTPCWRHCVDGVANCLEDVAAHLARGHAKPWTPATRPRSTSRKDETGARALPPLLHSLGNSAAVVLFPGEAEFLLSDVMTAPSQTVQLPLRTTKHGRALPKGCVVILKAEELANTNATVSEVQYPNR